MACCCCCLGALVALLVVAYVYFEKLYRKALIPKFRNRCVLVTGTDSGFGKKLALNLDKEGVKVYAGCFTDEGAQNLKKEALNKLVAPFKLDITNDESIKKAKAFVEEDLAKNGQELWGLVNNAGVFSGTIFHLSRLKHYKRTIEVNLFGTINMTEHFSPLIKKSHGRIVNVISIAGRSSVGYEPYSCSKWALEPYSDGLRRYMSDYGVRVAIIEPGQFETEMSKPENISKLIDECWTDLPQDLKDEYGHEFPQVMKSMQYKLRASKSVRKYNQLEVVTNAITHALFAVHPKIRYACGLDAKYAQRIIRILPDWIVDMLVRKKMAFLGYIRRNLKEREKNT